MRMLLRAVAGAALVAAVGFLLGHSSGTSHSPAVAPLDQHASAHGFRVSFPSGWRVVPARAVPRLALTGELALAPVALAPARTADAELVIGTARSADPSLLPATLLAALTTRPSPQVISLGGAHFYRYLNLTPGGGNVSESIYELPTTAGTITGVCAARSPTVAFTSGCEQVLATLRLTAGTVLEAGPDAGYALGLNQILASLNVVRTATGSVLRTGGPVARARAAAELAAAHGRAASAARRLRGTGVSGANRALAAALTMTAAAYADLGRAAARQNAGGYRRAQAEIVTATRALDAAFVRLRRLGYRVR
jgi:hypothetical protein